MTRADEDIKKNVVDQLYWDSRIDASRVEVKVENGKVTLSGEVPPFKSRRAAHTDTWIIPGVVSINDALKVKGKDKDVIPVDKDIEKSVQNSIDWDPDLDAGTIKAVVKDGWVTLEGSVEAYWKKVWAENLISSISGITGITNKISIVPGGGVFDEAIAEDVSNALERNPYIDAKSINVFVDEGIVTLTGSVPNWLVYNAAYESALYTNGVIDVRNYLVIEGSE